jgi:hypothetical protein
MEIQKKLQIIPGIKPLYLNSKGDLWANKVNKILLSIDKAITFNEVTSYKRNVTDIISTFSRLFQRLSRSGIHSITPLDGKRILCIARKKILRYDPNISPFLETVFRVPRGSRPLNLCRIPSGEIFFGEYFKNHRRESVNIYGSCDEGKTWNVVFKFSTGTIRHIHNIIYDEYRQGCWVFTGDRDHECKILFTDDRFETLNTVISGGQQSRAVSAIILKRGLIIPSDTPEEDNYIYFLNTSKKSTKKIYKLPGSAFFTGQFGNYLIVTTAVEPRRFDKKNYAAMYISEDEGKNWYEILRYEKDWLPKRFQHGAIVLPKGRSLDSIFFAYGQALKNVDGCMLMWKI